MYCKPSYTITNILGGNEDDISSKDFIDLNYEGALEFTIGDRFQFDVNTELFVSRIRLTLSSYDVSGAYSNINIKGYGFYTPVKWFGIAVGNSFFSKFAMKQYYFGALDDYPVYGKLLENGIGLYTYIDVFYLFHLPLKLQVV